MKGRKIILIVLSILILFLWGCTMLKSTQFSVGKRIQLNDEPIDLSEAQEIMLNQSEDIQSKILHEMFATESGEVDEKTHTYFTNETCKRNVENIFFHRSYAEDMAEFTYRNEVYRWDYENGSTELLYGTEEAYWMNEFEATGNYLYWVEYVQVGKETEYNIMQYNLEDETTECIASRNATETLDICLSVSEQYIVWYDDYGSGRIAIEVYDVNEKKLYTLQNVTVKKFMPYERMNIIDDGITFFSQDEEDNIFINRYNLHTEETISLFLGKEKDIGEMAGCFSNDRYLGWFTEYSYGTYYFYNMDSGELYSFNNAKETYIFSFWFSDYLYLNGKNAIYVCDLDTGKNWYQKLEGHGMQFRQCSDGQVYLEVRTNRDVKLIWIEAP